MITVAVIGAAGRMGSEVVKAVGDAPELELVAQIDRSFDRDNDHFASLEEALEAAQFDVLVDFTRPDVVAGNVELALSHGVNCIVGTTGLPQTQLEELSRNAIDGACLFVAPNFAIGAVMMMEIAQTVAKYMDHVEIIELHHDRKLDAPSGTALRTAELIAQARKHVPQKPGKETENPGLEGARGADYHDISIHSVRLPGLVAHQEVIFGDQGQTLTIRHDSIDRTSFMPGVVLACKKVPELSGLVVGLEHLLED